MESPPIPRARGNDSRQPPSSNPARPPVSPAHAGNMGSPSPSQSTSASRRDFLDIVRRGVDGHNLGPREAEFVEEYIRRHPSQDAASSGGPPLSPSAVTLSQYGNLPSQVGDVPQHLVERKMRETWDEFRSQAVREAAREVEAEAEAARLREDAKAKASDAVTAQLKADLTQAIDRYHAALQETVDWDKEIKRLMSELMLHAVSQ